MRRAKVWTPEEDALIAERYPHELNAVLAVEIGCSVYQVAKRAMKLRVRKSREFVSEQSRKARLLGWEVNSGPQFSFRRTGWPEWLLPSPPSGLEPRVTHVCRGDE